MNSKPSTKRLLTIRTQMYAFFVLCFLCLTSLNIHGADLTLNTNPSEESVLQGTNKKKTYTGTVFDSKQDYLIGVSVLIKGTQIGTVTNIDAQFSIEAEPGNTLVISYVGFDPKEIKLTDKEDLGTIILNEDTRLLNEVVVVGYGTMEKKQVTSSITSISAKDLTPGVGSSSVANAMQGKIGGLVISGNDSPNSANTFQLRGVASVNSGQEPLVVIDGMPGGDIRSVIPEDIVSIDVLKDASAGAIYGTRAAGGVILVTTKRAGNTDGKVSVSYTGELTLKQAYGKPRMLTAEEYVAYGRGTDYGTSTDWYDELLKDNPISQRHVLSMNGGTKNTQVYASIFYSEDQGLPINDSRTDYGGRINANFKTLEGWLDITMRADYRQAKRNLQFQETNDDGTDKKTEPNYFTQALRNNPTRSPYDSKSETGYNIWLNESLDYNVVADANLFRREGLDQWFKPDIIFKLNILPIEGLNYQQSIGFERHQWEEHKYRSMQHRVELEKNRRGEAYLGFDKTEHLSVEGYATYIKEINKHVITAVAGYSYFKSDGEGFNATNYNFSVDDVAFWDLGEGTYLKDGDALMKSSKDITEKLFAVFARGNYAYDDKYMGAVTLRREGSSKFAKDHRWGTFWALSGGWRISKEDFMKDVSFLNDLKLRAAYGVTGNNGFSASYAKTTYKSDQRWPVPSGGWLMTYGKTNTPNPDLKWEEKAEWNIGLDFSILKDRIYGKFDYYTRRVNNMLYNIDVSPPPFPKQTMMKNIGNLENRGWEVELGAAVVQSKDWNYSTSMNFSHNETKVLDLGINSYITSGGMPAPGSPGDLLRVEQNSKIGSFYLWKFAGFDKDGKFLLYNKDGDIIPAEDKKQDDRRQMGNFNPTLVIGWNHSVSYKNWDMTVNLRSWIDFDVYNTIDMYFGLPNDGQNTNVLKKAYEKNSHITGEKQLTDYFLEDGTFLKIDAIHLGYNLDLKKYTKNMFSNARFYVTVTNVATFTSYSGIDPEVNITGIKDNGLELLSFYPRTRGYTFGLQLSF